MTAIYEGWPPDKEQHEAVWHWINQRCNGNVRYSFITRKKLKVRGKLQGEKGRRRRERVPGSNLFCTFVQTISTGMPRLCVSVFSLSGSTTASSSPAVGARLCGEAGLASSGSPYSWNAFTTRGKQSKRKRETLEISEKRPKSIKDTGRQCVAMQEITAQW